jgi:hypothetical protein
LGPNTAIKAEMKFDYKKRKEETRFAARGTMMGDNGRSISPVVL